MIISGEKMIDTMFTELVSALERAGVASASILLLSGQFIEIGTHPPPKGEDLG
jgi:hypothetical protein